MPNTMKMPGSTKISTAKRINWRSAPVYLYLSVVALLVAGPVLFAFVGAFTPTGTIIGGGAPWFTAWTLENFGTAFRNSPLLAQFGNSVLVTLAQASLQLVTSLMAAYALVFGRLKRPNLVLAFFLITMMIPSETTIIANYLTIRSIGLFDTLIAVFIPFATSAYAVFLFRQAFKSFPKEIHEAAVLDGVGPLSFLFRFLLPLNKPIVMTVSLVSAIAAWNGYLWPLLITESPSSRTVQVGVAALSDSLSVDVGSVLAGLAFVSLPMLVLVIFGQKFLTKGLTQGAVK